MSWSDVAVMRDLSIDLRSINRPENIRRLRVGVPLGALRDAGGSPKGR